MTMYNTGDAIIVRLLERIMAHCQGLESRIYELNNNVNKGSGIGNFEVNLTNTLNHIDKQFRPVYDALKSIKEEKDTTKKALADITETLELIKQLPEIQNIITESKNKQEAHLVTFNQNILSLLMEDLPLSVRACKALLNNNIIRMLDLITKTENEILKIPNLGRVTLNEIKDLLREYGLCFGMSEEDISVWKTTNQIFRPELVYVGTDHDLSCVYIDPYTKEVINPADIGFANINKFERIENKLYIKKEHCNV